MRVVEICNGSAKVCWSKLVRLNEVSCHVYLVPYQLSRKQNSLIAALLVGTPQDWGPELIQQEGIGKRGKSKRRLDVCHSTAVFVR
jgi:hypothetical protein